jgi:hypothetical protein
MKDPAKCLGDGITGVDDARDVMKNNAILFFPILDAIIVNVDVTIVFGGMVPIINHLDGRFVFLKERSRDHLHIAKLSQKRLQVVSKFSGRGCGNKLTLGGAGCCDGLDLGMIDNNDPTC